MCKLLITGTPGVGKSYLAKKISEKYNIEHIDISSLIKSKRLYEKYDEKYDTYEFDDEYVAVFLNDYCREKNSFIIDTHSPSVAMDIKFDYIFHIKCDWEVLRRRLKNRKYSELKIEENIDVESFDEIGNELSECFPEKSVILVNGCEYEISQTQYKTDEIIDFISDKL
ncbi:hypothetical protein NUSPORA_00120 [Nucleospora cyclopteri]